MKTSKTTACYLHCIDGRRITSLLVALLRKYQGWSTISYLSEYWNYVVRDRYLPQAQDVEKQSTDIEKFITLDSDISHRVIQLIQEQSFF